MPTPPLNASTRSIAASLALALLITVCGSAIDTTAAAADEADGPEAPAAARAAEDTDAPGAPTRAEAAATAEGSPTYDPQLQSRRCLTAWGGGALGKRVVVYPGMFWYRGYQIPSYVTQVPRPTAYIKVALVNRRGRTVYKSGWMSFAPTRIDITDGRRYKVYILTAWRDPGLGYRWAYEGWSHLGRC